MEEFETTAIEDSDELIDQTLRERYMTFFLGEELYGFPLSSVVEIVGVQKITDVPDTDPFVKGVMNLRGQIMPLIDVRLRFGLPPRDYDDRTCVMVCHFEELNVGLIVDMVEEVMDIRDEMISPAPSVSTAKSGRFIAGLAHHGDKRVVILSLEKVLYSGLNREKQQYSS